MGVFTIPCPHSFRCFGFFFEQRKSVFSRFSFFNEGSDGEGEEDDGGSSTGKSFNEHWGWFGVIYSLSKTGILKMAGKQSITDLPLILVLNYLEIDKDYNQEEAKRQNTHKQNYNFKNR